MKDACRSIEDDRRMLMAEATEQNKLLDALSREKTCTYIAALIILSINTVYNIQIN